MNLRRSAKAFLCFIAILLITTVMPVTFSDNTQLEENNQEFQATQAELVNFLMHIHQTLSDFNEYNFNEELLENLQVEVDLALIVAQRSTIVATVEYSLGFLRVAYSSLLEDAIENEIDATELLLKELDVLNEENFTPSTWNALQEQLESVAAIVSDTLQELNDLEIEFDNDSNEDEEQNESPELSVRELPDLTSDLREIFDTLVETSEALVSFSHDVLETSVGADYMSDEIETDKFTDRTANELSLIYCSRHDDECLVALFQVARFELHNLLINHDLQHIDPLAFENAARVLTDDDLEEILETLERLLGSLES